MSNGIRIRRGIFSNQSFLLRNSSHSKFILFGTPVSDSFFKHFIPPPRCSVKSNFCLKSLFPKTFLLYSKTPKTAGTN
uniref:Uncharacterized protein n=1 Tax=Caenorhabditis tropicalis TaxID=1561998 RepID=A0A1I7TM57_9PELO